MMKNRIKLLPFYAIVFAVMCFSFSGCVKVNDNNLSKNNPSDTGVAHNFATSVVYAQEGMMPSPDATGINLRRTPIVIAVEKVSPSVVNISTEKIVQQRYNPFGGMGNDFYDNFFDPYFDRYFTRNYKQQTLGTGVIIDPRGYILTNEHVILRASEITVTMPDDVEYKAQIIGADPKFDLAILKINADKEFPSAKTGDSDSVMIGETVIAIGNPFGLSHTVTTGVLSAIGRSIKTNEGKVFSDFIQTDASINPGNSGGPLLNLNGEIIGINTVIYSDAQGIGFAIPINRAMRAVSELIRFGEIQKTWTGLRVQPVTKQIARHFGLTQLTGVLISDIINDSPASKAGLQSGDIVLAIDGKSISETDTFKDKISSMLAGDKVPLKIFREEKKITINLKLEAAPLERAGDIGYSRFGFKVTPVTEKIAAQYGLRTVRGTLITDVSNNSPAAETGLQPGDIIHQIGTREIITIDDYKNAVIQAAEQESVFMAIQRKGYLYHIKL